MWTRQSAYCFAWVAMQNRCCASLNTSVAGSGNNHLFMFTVCSTTWLRAHGHCRSINGRPNSTGWHKLHIWCPAASLQRTPCSFPSRNLLIVRRTHEPIKIVQNWLYSSFNFVKNNSFSNYSYLNKSNDQKIRGRLHLSLCWRSKFNMEHRY